MMLPVVDASLGAVERLLDRAKSDISARNGLWDTYVYNIIDIKTHVDMTVVAEAAERDARGALKAFTGGGSFTEGLLHDPDKIAGLHAAAASATQRLRRSLENAKLSDSARMLGLGGGN